MSDIQTYLRQILDAVYGEEVRNSIHDAISTMNSDLESAIQDDLNPLAFKGDLGESGGTNNNLNNLVQTDQRGIWRLKGSTTYTNVPSDFDNGKQGYVIMYAFGTSGQTATVAKQEIHYFSGSGANANVYWTRVYLSGEWQPWHKNVDKTLSIDGAAADAKAIGRVIAPTYSEEESYKVGSYTLHEGGLYRCIYPANAEEWTNSHWCKFEIQDVPSHIEKAMDDRDLLFRFARSTSWLFVARRASTDFIKVDGDFEIYFDEYDELVSINAELYDSNYDSLGDLYPDSKLRTSKIYFSAAANSNVTYVKIWLCGFTNSERDLTDDDATFVRRHIKWHDGITVREFDSDTKFDPSDFLIGRRKEKVFNKDVTIRAASTVLYKNTSDITFFQEATEYDYYFSFFDSNFAFVTDGAWHTYDISPYSENTSPYFTVTFRSHADPNANITQTDINRFCSIMNPYGPFLYSRTINAQGEIVAVANGIRAVENKRTYVKDGYVKMIDETYFDLDIVCFDSPTSKVIQEDYSWLGGPIGSFDHTDNAVRIQDRYIQCIVARHDSHQNSIGQDGYIDKLAELYNSGNLYRIYESIKPDEIGEEIVNGYSSYYDDEMHTTVNSVANKASFNQVKFAMITDLHDNVSSGLAETTVKQVNAIADIHKKIGLDFVICGGDLTDGGFSSKADLLDKFTDQMKMFKKIGVPVLVVRGNHDDNSYAGTKSSYMVTRKEFYTRCIAPFSGKKILNDKLYYYQDFDDVNARVICLDYIDYPWAVDSSGNVQYHAVGGTGVWRGYSDEQIVWLLATALNCDKRMIVTGHYSTHPNLMSDWEQNINHNYAVINQAIAAYNSRGSVTFGGNEYSFADKTGKVLMQVSGHSHSFGAFKDNGIVWSTTGSPSPEVTARTYDDTAYETMESRTYGDITEAHFNVFTCDESNVHIISFGQMGDLDFTI